MNNSFLVWSSITKKVVMGIAGLFLATFLVLHLSINLLLLANDNGEMYSKACEFMDESLFIKIFEYVLFGGFAIHIIMGIILFVQNFMARPVGYRKVSRTETSFFSRYMIYTGAVIVIFLIIHFMNFYFVKKGLVPMPDVASHPEDFYNMAIALFSNKVYSIIYLVCFLLLGFHLNHAIQSGFQTLGLNHSRYTPAVKIISTIYSVIIAAGFAIIPLYFLFIY